MIEAVESASETRWPTSNSKIAACLLVYGFKLCTEQPFIRIHPFGAPNKVSYSIWFQEAHPAHLTPSTPQDFEVAWRHKEELKNKTGRYAPPDTPDWRVPLLVMRRALEARQYFATNLIGRTKVEPLPERQLKVDDPREAICLISHGLHLFQPAGGAMIFDADQATALHRDFLEDAPTSMTWAKKAIIQLEILIAAIRKPDNTPNLRMKVGDRIAFVPVNMPPSIREPLVRLLYASH